MQYTPAEAAAIRVQHEMTVGHIPAVIRIGSGTVIMVGHRVIARRGIIGLAVRADDRIAISGAGLLPSEAANALTGKIPTKSSRQRKPARSRERPWPRIDFVFKL